MSPLQRLIKAALTRAGVPTSGLGDARILAARPHMQGVLLIGMGRVLESVLNLLQVRIYSGLLSIAEVGRLSLILAITTFFAQLLAAPMASFISRHTLEWIHEKNRLMLELRNYTGYLLAIVPFAAITVFAVNQYLVVAPKLAYWPLLLLITGNLLFFCIQQICVTVINILGDRKLFVALSNAALGIGITLSVVFVSTIQPTAELWQAGYLLGFGIVAPFALYVISVRRPSPSRTEATRAVGIFSIGAIAFVAPLAVSTISFWVQNYGYRMVIAANSSESTLGIFTLGITLGLAPMALVTKVANDYLIPSYYAKIAHQSQEAQLGAWSSFAARFISVAFLGAPLVAAAGPFLARFLLAPAYWNHAWLSYFGAGFQMLLMINGAYSMLAQGLRANALLVVPNIIAGAAIIATVGVLSLWRPLTGSGLGLLAGGLLLNAVTAWRFHRRYKIKLAWRMWAEATMGGIAGWILVETASAFLPRPSLLTSIIVLAGIGTYFVGSMIILFARSASRPPISPAQSNG